MADMEFTLSTDLRPVTGMEIESNIESIKAALAEIVKPYEQIIVTEEGYRTAKSDLARIRAVKAKIDDVRKSVKAQWLKPLKAFEDQIKGALAAADNAENNLNSQIKEIEQRRRDERMAALEAFWEEKAGPDVADMVSFDKIANPKWGNATYDTETAQKEITQTVASINMGLAAIRSMEPQYKAALLTEFKKAWSITDVMELHEKLKQAEEAEHKREQRFAEERLAREADYRKRQEEMAREAVERGEQCSTLQSEQIADEPVLVCDFRVWGTRAQLSALKQYMKDNGIKIGRVGE